MTELDRLVDGYLADDLTPAERDELVALLKGDRAKEFVEALDWRTQLAEAAGQVRSAYAADAPERAWRDRSHRRRLALVVGALAAAAALVISLWPTEAPPVDNPWDGPVVARVAKLLETQSTETPVIMDQAFVSGESLHLDAGRAVVEMADGTRVMLEEQTTVIFDAPRQIYLKRGRVSVLVAPDSDGFEVVTANTRVVDHGTEFGVIIQDDGTTAAHVFDGSVSVGEAGAARLDRIVYAGNAVMATDDGSVVETPLRPDLFRTQDVYYPVAIHSTGLDTEDGTDSHWQTRLSNSDEWLPTQIITPLKMVRPSDPSSKWIAYERGKLPDDETYPFRTTFLAEAPGPVELVLTARLMADDYLTAAWLDGEVVWRPSAEQTAVKEPWGREFVEVEIRRMIEPGRHVLTFDTRNHVRSVGKREANYTGFRAEFDAVLVRRGLRY